MRHLLRSALIVAALAIPLAASVPAVAGTLVVTGDQNPDSLDPALAYAPGAWQILVNAGEGLVAYRHAPSTAGSEVVPALATAMPKVLSGGRRLVFRLRPGARFGPPADRPVLPSDVKASIERLFLADSPGRSLFRVIVGAPAFERTKSGGIAGIVARDATGEVEFRLSRPQPSLLQALALPFGFAVPKGTPPTDQSTQAIASAGPYRVSRYVPGQRIDLARNPGYVAGAAGPAPGGPDAIRVDLGVSSGEGIRRIGAGDADYSMARASSADVGLARTLSAARLRRHVEGTTYYLFMNTRRAPFDDVRVRRAVNLAIDRRAMARAFAGQAVPSTGVMPPGVPGNLAGGTVAGPDVAAARALVRRAGATGATVAVWGTTFQPSPTVTAQLTATLTRIGLKPLPRLFDRAALLDTLSDPAAPSQIGYARWRNDYPDGDDWFTLLLSGKAIRPGANLNYSLFSDAAVDRLIAQASATWDPAVRAQRWQAVERAVARRAPWAPFANIVRTDVVSSRVGRYVAHPLYGFLWDESRVP
ncbi:MAG: ABC transporter substrate-binding protein [Thermoleophilia bacterium]